MPLEPQPPPLAPPSALLTTLTILHKLIFDIQLPKTKSAKTCAVPLDTLNTLRSLSATLVKHPAPSASGLAQLSSKIDTLTSKLDSLPHLKPLYASVTHSASPTPTQTHPLPAFTNATAAHARSAAVAPRNTSLDLTLTPKDRRSPAFPNQSPSDILVQFNTLMVSLDYPYGEGMGHAVAKHRNGNIRLVLSNSDALEHLQANLDQWIPAFSTLLSAQQLAYAIVVHRVPTTFNPDVNGPDVECLIKENDAWIYQDNPFTRTHWISRRPPDQLRAMKAHSSLVLHCISAEQADALMKGRIAIEGTLHHTEKYRPHPPQCYNCFRFGHIAALCKHAAACGICAGTHRTSECLCPSQPPCKDTSQCTHIARKCATPRCSGAHRATDHSCPVRQALPQQVDLQ